MSPAVSSRYSRILLIRLMRGSRSNPSSRVNPNPISDFMWTSQASPPSSVCDFAIAGKQRDVDRLHLLSALPRVLDVCERQTGELVDRTTWCQGTGQPLDRVA